MAGPPSIAPWAELEAPLEQDSAFIRLWRGFATARVAIAAVLLLMLVAPLTLGTQPQVHAWPMALSATYLAATLAVRIFSRPMPQGAAFDPQWVSTIGIDLLAFSALQFVQAGGINYSPLFAVPVLMAAVLGSALLAFGTAAAVTLLLLTEAWLVGLQLPADLTARLLQAGLTGTGYFALAFLANQLAVRLAGEERMARRSHKAARMQAQVNELVIESVSDGVLVVDPRGEVHALNPAARLLMDAAGESRSRPFGLVTRPAWQPLMEVAQITFALRDGQSAEIALEEPGQPPRRVSARTRLTNPDGPLGESLCVIFLEDLREMEARLRTEKLAAMGRMSAAVAHEIRNPLAAITQANALLDEDLRDPAQKQLSGMVAQNAQRLAQVVDDILNLSRVQHQGQGGAPDLLALDSVVATACGDWARQARCDSRLQLELSAGSSQVRFEPEHLRRVLVNLLDNALRYASRAPGAIRVATSVAAGQATLSVWSDGAALEPTVQRHLFEPFFSSESRSSGLGLYICRELCERHGAQIAYRRREQPPGSGREGNDFMVGFNPGRPTLAGAVPFDTIAAP